MAPASSSDVCDPHGKRIGAPFAYMAHNAMYALRAGTGRIYPNWPPYVPDIKKRRLRHFGNIRRGRERTEVEYRALFDAAGLKLTRIVPTLFPVSLIEGMRK